MSMLNQVFGVASSTAYIRAGGSGENAKQILASLAKGFGGSTGDGIYVHNLFAAQTGAFTQLGFDTSSVYYNTLESRVPSLTGPYQIGAGAIIYAYANFSNMSEEDVVGYINSFSSTLKGFRLDSPATFTHGNLEYAMSQFTLTGINYDIGKAPSQNEGGKAVNYNWYDSSPLFVNPNLGSVSQLIKDTECQYYYVSGELIYSNLPTGLENCISYNQVIATPTGSIVIKKYQKTPCVEKSGYAGPISGITFYRKFVDGPGSSGLFDQETMLAYIDFDKAAMDWRDSSFNSDVIFSSHTDENGFFVPLRSGVVVDVAGIFQSGREYGAGHTNVIVEECTNHPAWPMMRMHQGDNKPKISCYSYKQTYPDTACNWSISTGDFTGWKLTAFELKPSLAKNYKDIKTNPYVDTGRILKRILNLNNYATEFGPVSPYAYAVDTGDGVLTCGDSPLGSHYTGPPQLNGQSSLPGFAFYQTFDNVNFPSGGEFASIVMRPMITQDADGFSVSDFNVFSGTDAAYHAIGTTQANINFYVLLHSSGMAAKDDIFKKCFSMGDNFNNQVSGVLSLQSNAGYTYTGYSYYRSGILVSAGTLLNEGTQRVCDTYSTVKYPRGYKSGSHSFYTSDQIGYIITGDSSSGVSSPGIAQKYKYFNNGVLGASNAYWQDTEFAPIPMTVADNYWEFSPIYDTAPVENYLPRYITGPYLTYDTKFLYPNAEAESIKYGASFGFPTGIKYVISIKEETVREAHLVSGIGGIIRRKVIRAGTDYSPLALKTIMSNPFSPNDPGYAFKYDYLRNKSLFPDEGSFFQQACLPDELVNGNYVPTTNHCPQASVNSTVYLCNETTFNQGVRITGHIKPRNIYTGKSGASVIMHYTEPVGAGLYWGYNGKKVSGEMRYCPPAFDLNTYSLTPSESLTSAMVNNIYGATNNTCSNDGKIFDASLYDYSDSFGYEYKGKDPLFYEYIGGRSGSGAEMEGGYHSKGLIGDAWYDVTSERFGWTNRWCDGYPYGFRHPASDKYLFLCNTANTGMTIFTRGLSFYPYYGSWKYKPFTTSSLGGVGVNVIAKEVTKSNFYFDFDMNEKFYPLKSGLTSLSQNGLYVSGGVNIGPFDRDVEFCITGTPLIPSGALIIDGQQVTDPSWNGGCTHPVTFISANSGIIKGEAGRFGKVTTFKLIPSGSFCNINISGTGLIGVGKSMPVTIRPRTCFSSSNYDGEELESLSGDAGYMNEFNYINNGSETSFSFPISNSFSDLVGQTFSITTQSREEILYPIPDSEDFDLVLKPTLDVYGNKTYKSNPTREYWKIRNPNGQFSGVREVTRLHISVDSIEVGFGDYPYQTFKTLIPSGSCLVSGKFGYIGEAESAIISDGIVLSGFSGASLLTGRFNPSYVSEVLQRLPSGIYSLPSGSGHKPVLSAPSYMKERKNPFIISGNDEYVFVSPYPNSNYNAFLWPAWSDLALLNPEVVYEQMPPDDGNVFMGSYLTFSAAQGQKIASGNNPIENVTYKTIAQYAMIDSVATNSIYNTGKCIFSGVANKTTLNSGDLSGILTTEGNSLTMAVNLNNFKT
jgi:hypothetical protein